nr:hypothetical protein Iba_chr10dCG4440 [Ipomoea batatas]
MHDLPESTGLDAVKAIQRTRAEVKGQPRYPPPPARCGALINIRNERKDENLPNHNSRRNGELYDGENVLEGSHRKPFPRLGAPTAQNVDKLANHNEPGRYTEGYHCTRDTIVEFKHLYGQAKHEVVDERDEPVGDVSSRGRNGAFFPEKSKDRGCKDEKGKQYKKSLLGGKTGKSRLALVGEVLDSRVDHVGRIRGGTQPRLLRQPELGKMQCENATEESVWVDVVYSIDFIEWETLQKAVHSIVDVSVSSRAVNTGPSRA